MVNTKDLFTKAIVPCIACNKNRPNPLFYTYSLEYIKNIKSQIKEKLKENKTIGKLFPELNKDEKRFIEMGVCQVCFKRLQNHEH